MGIGEGREGLRSFNGQFVGCWIEILLNIVGEEKIGFGGLEVKCRIWKLRCAVFV